MKTLSAGLGILLLAHPAFSQTSQPEEAVLQTQASSSEWTQWRGSGRDGRVLNEQWPSSLDESVLKETWSLDLGPSYSGPIVVGNRIFVTETKDKQDEVVTALDKDTGAVVWQKSWPGAMSVPFFAKSNGDWIRSTPAWDEGKLYVSGIRDRLVCLNAEDGTEIWNIDFPNAVGSPLPNFGCVCSPLIDGQFLYMQAGGGFCKVNKTTGEIVWRVLDDGGGMSGSAFSSPSIATLAGVRQLLVQSRESLHGIEPDSGKELWSQKIPAFRGMNILTPTTYQNGIFVSTYGGTTQFLSVTKSGNNFSIEQAWNLSAQGYMTTPVVIDGHAFTFLRNKRFACFDLNAGKENWRSKAFGKYVNLITNGKLILALDERGELLLLKANPKQFELLDSRTVAKDAWAHLAISGDQLFVRHLDGIKAFTWKQ